MTMKYAVPKLYLKESSSLSRDSTMILNRMLCYNIKLHSLQHKNVAKESWVAKVNAKISYCSSGGVGSGVCLRRVLWRLLVV
jgi:hypothetical protein